MKETKEFFGGKKKIILDLIEKNRPLSVTEISNDIGIAKSTTSRHLEDLKKLGIITYNETKGTLMKNKMKKDIKIIKKNVKIKIEWNVKNEFVFQLIPFIPAFIILVIFSFMELFDSASMLVSGIIFFTFNFLYLLYKILKSPKEIRVFGKISVSNTNKSVSNG